ncbi:MAG: PIN domain-containing protein [Bacteroidota bacterium]
MRVFLDANILVAVINKEYPLFTYASRIMSLADNSQYEVFTSPLCLAIAFYFAEKKHRTKAAKQKIKLLAENISITDITEDCVQKSLQNIAINDFEDGLEYYAAVGSKCRCIITEDVKDFYFSDIEVLTSESFFNKYMAAKNSK